jgi:hypothetical protein
MPLYLEIVPLLFFLDPLDSWCIAQCYWALIAHWLPQFPPSSEWEKDNWLQFVGFDTLDIGSLSKDYSYGLIIIIEAAKASWVSKVNIDELIHLFYLHFDLIKTIKQID